MTEDEAISIVTSNALRHAAHLTMLDDVAAATGGVKVHALEVQRVYKAVDVIQLRASEHD